MVNLWGVEAMMKKEVCPLKGDHKSQGNIIDLEARNKTKQKEKTFEIFIFAITIKLI